MDPLGFEKCLGTNWNSVFKKAAIGTAFVTGVALGALSIGAGVGFVAITLPVSATAAGLAVVLISAVALAIILSKKPKVKIVGDSSVDESYLPNKFPNMSQAERYLEKNSHLICLKYETDKESEKPYKLSVKNRDGEIETRQFGTPQLREVYYKSTLKSRSKTNLLG